MLTQHCQRCATAWVGRQFGYGVTAGAGMPPNLPAYRDAFHATHHQKYFGIYMAAPYRTVEGKVRLPYNAVKARRGLKGGINMATVKDVEESVPDGAFGVASAWWSKEDYGHAFCWRKSGGKIEFVDGQTGKILPPSAYLDLAVSGSLQLTRVDDLYLVDTFLDYVGVEGKPSIVGR